MYTVSEAVTLVQAMPVQFDASVELHACLGIDPKKSDQILRGTVQLPHGTGKIKRVIAFVSPAQEVAAKAAGADIVGTAEVIAQIKKTEQINFDVAVATPDMMKGLASVARILGQKGLMPNPRTDTVGADVTKMITAIKAGKVNFKNDDTGNVHLAVGKVSFTAEQLVSNITAAIDALKRARPAAAKGTFIKRLVVCTTMGPAIPVASTTADHGK